MLFSNIGKVYLLNLDFSANWECFRSIGNFFSQLGKNLVPETGPSFIYREKALILFMVNVIFYSLSNFKTYHILNTSIIYISDVQFIKQIVAWSCKLVCCTLQGSVSPPVSHSPLPNGVVASPAGKKFTLFIMLLIKHL